MLLLDLFKPIRLFIFDVDGVMTDGTILIGENGNYVRRMNIKDGYALQLAKKKGYDIMVVSGSDADAVRERMQKLGILNVHLKVTDKPGCISKYISDNDYRSEEVLFMGDDLPDVAAMHLVGLPCCPADAVPEIKQVCKYISPFNGGDTCVRDVIEKVMKLNAHWHHIEDVASR
jgi:3-deoxy-D-manno-octulosonate 8-phosphate phosphatase (KDO 8-P phosphatase)